MFGPQLTGVLARSIMGGGHAPLLDEAWDIAEDQFYGELPTDQDRTYGAVRGMMESFKDPYTVFIEPPQTELQSQQLSGKFGGIGASVRRETDGRYVLSPFPDRPAAQAGVQEGDVLIKIDDTSITTEMKSRRDYVAAARRSGHAGEESKSIGAGSSWRSTSRAPRSVCRR